MLKIERSKYNKNGDIEGYILSNGEFITNDKAMKMTNEGKISDAIVGVDENGVRVIHTMPDFK